MQSIAHKPATAKYLPCKADTILVSVFLQNYDNFTNHGHARTVLRVFPTYKQYDLAASSPSVP